MVVNKLNTSATVTVAGADGANASWVDYNHGYGAVPYASSILTSDSVACAGWAVLLLQIK